ncbi:hypothetical protein L596_018389 [Steinernema carpocapsae]|uniref:Uncharacterized protein n=1 Tax=Steinernema carpocapsae TaxID=34508 RepID=A0A4U5N4G9_STECR|nr:hypothetical protein L596_018389 [Steinernema carpocapsae]
MTWRRDFCFQTQLRILTRSHTALCLLVYCIKKGLVEISPCSESPQNVFIWMQQLGDTASVAIIAEFVSTFQLLSESGMVIKESRRFELWCEQFSFIRMCLKERNNVKNVG